MNSNGWGAPLAPNTGATERLPTSLSSIIAEGLAEGGQALPQAIRSPIESRSGQSFAQVRLHVNPRTSVLPESLQPRAFTLGQEIFFTRDNLKADGARIDDIPAGKVESTPAEWSELMKRFPESPGEVIICTEPRPDPFNWQTECPNRKK